MIIKAIDNIEFTKPGERFSHMAADLIFSADLQRNFAPDNTKIEWGGGTREQQTAANAFVNHLKTNNAIFNSATIMYSVKPTRIGIEVSCSEDPTSRFKMEIAVSTLFDTFKELSANQESTPPAPTI